MSQPAPPPLPDLLDLSPDEVVGLLAEMGQKPYRARQLLAWIYRKGVTDFAGMTDIPDALRLELARRLRIGGGTVQEALRSQDARTAKYLFRWDDGELTEAVAMHEESRLTACISSQVGCALGCAFCCTGTLGFTRDLRAGEILFQALEINRSEAPITNIVFMGMGEPLLNVENVLKAVAALTDPARFGLGTRKVTISTSGVIPGIQALAESGAPVRLALSLNSPFQQQRAEMMPIARKYPLHETLDACEAYTAKTGKPVLLEYVLLRGVNTDRSAARSLAAIARRLNSKVNLIEYNPGGGMKFDSPESQETLQFRDWLMKDGLLATIRFRRGRDIAAGCGQLTARRKKGDNAVGQTGSTSPTSQTET